MANNLKTVTKRRRQKQNNMSKAATRQLRTKQAQKKTQKTSHLRAKSTKEREVTVPLSISLAVMITW